MNPNLTIQEVMTSELVTVQPNESLTGIREIFSKHTFHHIPVIENGGNLAGIISREDFYKVAFVLSVEASKPTHVKNRFEQLTAHDIMTKYPLRLSPDDTLGLAADIFLANKFHAIPIVEDGNLVGILTSHDLLSYCFNSPVGEQVETEEFEES
ncbi:MAG: CBS domain-containing protein [Bacteroidetes bacterium]|nr:CBS domain-containing protein [Bacteroidota bacterium]